MGFTKRFDQNLPYERISILAVIQNIWDLHKFGLQI